MTLNVPLPVKRREHKSFKQKVLLTVVLTINNVLGQEFALEIHELEHTHK